ncbi:MAG: S1 RNA-binding domain-containing protein [Candidatus Margulisbacteria bacterium]|jgi:ribosomal protein S1|nr:S1 RNA-binding domain-containing protein [Candidatus Margulisiibacteriota bacterium]
MSDILGSTGFEDINLEERSTAPQLKEKTLQGTTLSQEAVAAEAAAQKEQAQPQELSAAEDDFEKLFGSVKNYQEGDIITGIVSKIINNSIYVDIAFKSEGIIEPSEISNHNLKATEVCQVGDKISVKILRLENKAGNPILSKKRADYELAWTRLNAAEQNNEDILVKVTGKKDGGLNVDFQGISAYVPASQLDREDLTRLDSLVGSTIYCKILKAARSRKRLLLSHKASREKTLTKLHEALKTIKPGEVVHGKVSSIKSFGAFVNLGEFDGLIHISELAWDRVATVEEALEVGQEIDVYVIGIDEENTRISLSLKRLQKDPWEEAVKDLRVGDKLPVTITRLAQFGAFAQIKEGVEGLIHITEMSDEKQVKYPQEVVQSGQELEATIIRLEPQNKKIALSLRQHAELTPEAASLTQAPASPVNG